MLGVCIYLTLVFFASNPAFSVEMRGFYVGQVNAGCLHLLDLGVLCFESCIL